MRLMEYGEIVAVKFAKYHWGIDKFIVIFGVGAKRVRRSFNRRSHLPAFRQAVMHHTREVFVALQIAEDIRAVEVSALRVKFGRFGVKQVRAMHLLDAILNLGKLFGRKNFP
jgi:hypothetical protein